MIEYNGMKLEEITEGYWPEGVTLVAFDGCAHKEYIGVVCLCNSFAFIANGVVSFIWPHWAVLPPKPPARRLTNREVHDLCKKGYSLNYNDMVTSQYIYAIGCEDYPCGRDIKSLRAPDSDEWVEPTSEVLE
jgi:hypothetical protein